MVAFVSVSLLQSSDASIREQAVACLRNVVTGPDETELIVQGIGAERLSSILKSLMECGHADTTAHVSHPFCCQIPNQKTQKFFV